MGRVGGEGYRLLKVRVGRLQRKKSQSKLSGAERVQVKYSMYEYIHTYIVICMYYCMYNTYWGGGLEEVHPLSKYTYVHM